jgi:hypothetical protein
MLRAVFHPTGGFKMIRHYVLLAAAVFVSATFAQQGPELTDVSAGSFEAKAIKNLVGQGIMPPVAPGKFDPTATMKRGDFVVALQRLFNLPAPARQMKFSDVHQGDVAYTAIEAVAPYMDKQVPCPGCDIGAKFSSDAHVSRAESAITLVRILLAQNKLQLLGDAESDKVLSSVPDSQGLPKRTRPYIATAIQAGILECCAGNTIESTQLLTRADAAETLDRVQRRFDIPPAKQGG